MDLFAPKRKRVSIGIQGTGPLPIDKKWKGLCVKSTILSSGLSWHLFSVLNHIRDDAAKIAREQGDAVSVRLLHQLLP